MYGQNQLQKDDARDPAARAAGASSLIQENGTAAAGRERRSNRSIWQFFSSSERREVVAAPKAQWEHQALLWIAFSFAGGITVYTLLPEEPFWPVLGLVLAAAVVFLIWNGSRKGVAAWFLLALSFWAGLTCASIRTAFVDAPRLSEEMNVTLTGHVIDRQERAGGLRLVIGVGTVNDRSREDVVFPVKVRIRVPRDTQAGVGSRVQVRARLFPPAGPAVPGGYDFSFRAYFSQIGATGFSFGALEVLPERRVPLRLAAIASIQAVRDRLADRIKSYLPEKQETALVVALLVGDRSGIDAEQEENLRAAGLAHILAISGLHMALFAGGTYAAALFFLALLPGRAQRWPIHKLSAVAALVAAVFYLLVSGASVATQRSFLMIALVFLGILIGRRGLTLRSVALAGLLLLLLAPERLFFPGFQMSFAAVICLVAIYETWRNRLDPFARHKKPRNSLAGRAAVSVSRWIAGILITALVAGLATGIIAAFHFGRVAPFGLLGNLLGMPVFTLLVMPMGVLAVVLMPFGLSALPLAIMSGAITILLEIAAMVSGLDGGAGAIGRLTLPETLALSAALFAGLLMRGRWRLTALAPLAAGILLMLTSPPPDGQISGSSDRIAARDENGHLRWSGKRRTFLTDMWYQSEGLAEGKIISRKMKSPQRTCDQDGCVVRAYASRPEASGSETRTKPLLIAFPKSLSAFHMDCKYADLIVSDLIAPNACSAGIVIDRRERAHRGAVSVWLTNDIPPKAGAPPGQAGAMDLTGVVGTKIGRLRFALDPVPRPWHRKADVTRANLR